MGLAATITKGASVVTAIGAIGGGAFYLDARHAPMTVVSEMAVSRIYDLVAIAQRDGREDWICRAIDEELARLCTKIPDHYFCVDTEARSDIKAKAGCQ
jgi:hypothetical protein